MFDSGKKSGGCGSGPEAVSYLYGELDAKERSAFEDHLAVCEECAEDLAAFSLISLSLSELEKTESVAVVASGGLLDQLRRWISAYPLLIKGLAGAATAFIVALAILGYLFTRGTSGEDGLTKNTSPNKPSPVKKTDEPSQNVDTQTVIAKSSDSEDSGDNLAKAEDDGASSTSSGATNRTVRRRAPRTKNPATRLPKNQVADSKEPPRLSEAAEENVEDDSLRLTDLFAETGSGD